MFYRAARKTKHILIDYLNKIFDAYRAGTYTFMDGDEQINFSAPPRALETEAWERLATPALPVVLFGSSVGPVEWLDLRDYLDTETVTVAGVDYARDTFGGEMQLELEILCIAGSKEERDNLVDTVTILLSVPAIRAVLGQRGINLYSKPSFAGESLRETSTGDRPLHQGTLRQPLQTQWEEYGDNLETMTEILVELTLVLDISAEI